MLPAASHCYDRSELRRPVQGVCLTHDDAKNSKTRFEIRYTVRGVQDASGPRAGLSPPESSVKNKGSHEPPFRPNQRTRALLSSGFQILSQKEIRYD